MPSIENRSTDISATHVKASEGPVAAPVAIPAMPTPNPPYVGRHPRMISSLPSIFSTPDAAMRQFYGRAMPVVGRVALL